MDKVKKRTITSLSINVIRPLILVHSERVLRLGILDHADLIVLVDEEAQLVQLWLKDRVWREGIWAAAEHVCGSFSQ